MMLGAVFACAMTVIGTLLEQGPRSTAVVMVGTATHYTFVAAEQELHPGEDELYIGGLYDVRMRDLRVLAGKNDIRDLRRTRIRVLMTHPWPKPRSMLMFFLRHETGPPIAVWWDWADDGRTCVPSETVERFAPQFLAAAKMGKLCAG